MIWQNKPPSKFAFLLLSSMNFSSFANPDKENNHPQSGSVKPLGINRNLQKWLKGTLKYIIFNCIVLDLVVR